MVKLRHSGMRVTPKWFVPEVHSSDAARLRNPTYELHVPGLFDVEVANIVWKKIRRGELSRQEGDQIIAQIALLPIQRHPDLTLVALAFDLADRTQRTVYDCLYLALAMQLGGQVVTADQRLINSLTATPWAMHVISVESV
jgi:predicted nucleic acid-binding protein